MIISKFFRPHPYGADSKLIWPHLSVPDQPGDLLITSALVQQFRAETVDHPGILGGGVQFHRASVGRRRLLADGALNEQLARAVSIELHTGGTGVYALQLYDVAAERNGGRADDTGPADQIVDDELIASGVASGLVRLAQHARDRAGAGGNAVIRAVLTPARKANSLRIGYARQGFPDSRSVSMHSEDVVAEGAAPLDGLASPGPTTAATVAVLIDELGQAFGIPELGQFSREGEVRSRYWRTGSQHHMVTWAHQNGITVSTETLQST